MQRNLKTYCFDLDQTICHQSVQKEYFNSYPDEDMIRKINFLHDSGHQIIIFTARGMSKFKGDLNLILENYYDMTYQQLLTWNLKFHRLIFGKPSYDFIIDDKIISINDFKKSFLPKRGFVAGMFDVIHPGYIDMFDKAKNYCDYLVIGLHDNPNLERSNKCEPVLSFDERSKILKSIKYVDEIIKYRTESELLEILKSGNFDLRFLGDDYLNASFTGEKLSIPILYINRSHGWSSTKFKTLINKKIIS